ncbi:MAG: NfeD family protein [Vallitaleaceae bacterium]|nr:NfeD family protein [Vallitaleaceae bacterium]
MVEWWNDLGIVRQIFYFFAVPATAILLIQSILSLIGLADFDAEVDMPGDMDVSSGIEDSFFGDFQFFTIRGLVAFFSVFGWTGAALADSANLLFVAVIAFGAGALAMFAIGYLFYAMSKLQANGNIRYDNCLGKTGEVYLTIPPVNQGRGKVTLTVQERLIEVSAITEGNAPIKTGEQVKVIRVLDDHTVVVEKE